jgi:hypothetical protein
MTMGWTKKLFLLRKLSTGLRKMQITEKLNKIRYLTISKQSYKVPLQFVYVNFLIYGLYHIVRVIRKYLKSF